jgi:hypothetical protein
VSIFPKLDGLARRDGVDIRPTLVRVLTDLYVQRPSHTSEEERHYTELVLRLIDSVDLPTRVTVARKIANYAGSPPAIARRLARDVIEVADPILRRSQVLTAAELDAVARDFGAKHAAAIISRREPQVAAPAVEQAAPPAPIMPDRAIYDVDLGLAELFFSADPAERRMLLTSLGSADSERTPRFQPVETNRALETAALARDRIGFAQTLENALGIAHEQAERIVADPSGEAVLIAAKALAMPSVMLQRILLFINPAIGESVQRVFDLASLYERMSADAAHKIVASLRGTEQSRTRRPVHRTMYYDDEATRVRRGTLNRLPSVAAEPQAPARNEPATRQRTI